MSTPRKAEARFLDKEEGELVSRTRFPLLREQSDGDLADLIKLLRDRRDRARDIAHQQTREMRGKSAPAGAQVAAGNGGTREKGALLGEAVKRAGKERARRTG